MAMVVEDAVRAHLVREARLLRLFRELMSLLRPSEDDT